MLGLWLLLQWIVIEGVLGVELGGLLMAVELLIGMCFWDRLEGFHTICRECYL